MQRLIKIQNNDSLFREISQGAERIFSFMNKNDLKELKLIAKTFVKNINDGSVSLKDFKGTLKGTLAAEFPNREVNYIHFFAIDGVYHYQILDKDNKVVYNEATEDNNVIVGNLVENLKEYIRKETEEHAYHFADNDENAFSTYVKNACEEQCKILGDTIRSCGYEDKEDPLSAVVEGMDINYDAYNSGIRMRFERGNKVAITYIKWNDYVHDCIWQLYEYYDGEKYVIKDGVAM